MAESSPRSSVGRSAQLSAAVSEWLRDAAACLVDSSRPLSPPPHPDLGPTYEAILISRQQMEQSQRELIANIHVQSLQMVGSMLAHDLHNLSQRLALLSQNLERFYGDPAFLQSAKHTLDDTVDRMQVLVDSFRERQETVVIKIPTDVNEVLRTLVRQMELERILGIEVVADFAARSHIWADPFFLANAFRALIQNAVEAMPQGGRLILRTRSDSAPEGNVEVEVVDTGIGMTREFVGRELFVPFRSSKGRGLGLGMCVCRQIVQLHEGELQVESEPGRGTRIRLQFPRGPD